MSEVTFYRCAHCGNIAYLVNDSGVNPVCCGEKMERLVPGSVDAAAEKHVPVVTHAHGGHVLEVAVGSVAHPMAAEHHIAWIAVASEGRVDFRFLEPGQEPKATFGGAEHGAAYAYCNLHGLWKAEF